MLLDYAATYPNAVIHYKYSVMFLHVDSDAAYINMPEIISCYAGNFYLSDWPSPRLLKLTPKNKWSYPHRVQDNPQCGILSSRGRNMCHFKKLKTDIGMQPTSIALDHKQPATPFKTKNSTT